MRLVRKKLRRRQVAPGCGADVGAMAPRSRFPGRARPGSEALGGQVELPAGFDPPERQMEAVPRREGLAPEREAGFLRGSVLLPRVALAARRHDVVPDVESAPGARDHVVEVLCGGPAVLAGAEVTREHRSSREGG